MRVVTFNMPNCGRVDEFKITLMGDEHCDARDFDKKLHAKCVAKIASEENHYAILMGDPCDFIGYRDKRFSPKEHDIVNDGFRKSCDYYVNLLRPIPESRLIGKIEGNHDEHIAKNYLFDPHEYICEKLSPRVGFNLGYSCFLKLRFRRNSSTQTIKFCLHHGGGSGGKREGAVVNSVEDLEKSFPFCHVYATGHLHDRFIKPLVKTDCLDKSDTLIERSRVLAMSGTFKRTLEQDHTNWEERTRKPPKSRGVVTIIVKPFADDGFPVLDGAISTSGLPA